jgi:hypothetical protein
MMRETPIREGMFEENVSKLAWKFRPFGDDLTHLPVLVIPNFRRSLPQFKQEPC